MPPTVSVIIPNYNHGRFLSERLDSILAQTFQDFELIVLDDASTDNSCEILTAYSHRAPMQLLFNERNNGNPFAQWRRGADLARGKYLWIAESDDYADPRLLEILIGKLEQNPNVGLAYCQSMMVDENGFELGTHLERHLSTIPGIDVGHWKTDYVENGRRECANYMVYANTIPNASGVLVRRDLFLQADGATPELRLTGDWLKWINILLMSDVAFTAAPLNRFREHKQTVRKRTAWGAMFTEFTVIRSYLASAFRGESDVRRRIRRQVAHEWSADCSRIESSDSWGWFLRLGRSLWNVSPRGFMVGLFWYSWYRLLHAKMLADLRQARRRITARRV